MRFRCTDPLTVPHTCTNDTMLQGHRIPKNATLCVNLRSIMMDESYWGDPFVFRPDRFIADDGTLKKDERVIIFGKGKRVCAGEALGRMSTFLLFAGLTAHLSFFLPPGDPVPDTEGVTGFTLGPPPFRIIAKRRNHSSHC
ncbi:cytochrome P450 2D14-like [Hyalella azteca]|uniref:unspecific monooxygenase n=2 Tax=Hyalella azteca TaxID=294128 RepID=A0A8B7P237_HYAAZ|nr:cytochrome P450 2D14-like [Hyalella azteca]